MSDEQPPPLCPTCGGAGYQTDFRACPPCRRIRHPPLVELPCVMCRRALVPLWWCAFCLHMFHVPDVS